MFHKITEIKNFKEVLEKDIHYDTWVVLDLDNTVMTHRLELGGDAWFNGLFKHLSQHKIDKKTALPWVLSVYNTMQHFIRTSVVEPDIIIIIKALQHIGIPVIGLTARGHSIRHQTIRQLADIGIDFSQHTIVNNDDSSYSGGIIFCDGKNKGEKLNLFLSQIERLPKHVCMLDDKKSHLEDVMHILKPLNINFSGFRYSYLDEKVNQFNMEMATLQLAHLWEWLSSVVQQDIINLKLIPSHLQGPLNPLVYKDHVFHPNHPLSSIENKSNVQMELPTCLVRSKSSSSFFHKFTQKPSKACLKRKRDHIESKDINDDVPRYRGI